MQQGARRSREKEPLTGMAQAPGSKSAPTAGSDGRWRQRASETERGDEERGKPWCSIHRFDTTKPSAEVGDRRRAHASGCGKRTSIWRHHAGNGGHERRPSTGDRGWRDDKTNRRDVGHAGRHAYEKPRISLLVHQETGANSERDRSNETEESATPETSLLGTEGVRGRQICVLEVPLTGALETEREVSGKVTWDSLDFAQDAAFGQRSVS